MTVALPQMSRDLAALVARATAAYDALSPSQKLRHRYMQRRSFARGMASSRGDYVAHCARVEEKMPDEAGLTDAQIGLLLIGEKLT